MVLITPIAAMNFKQQKSEIDNYPALHIKH